MNPVPGQRPAWVDADLFPFASRFVTLGGHTVHYVDEGDGPVLLMLHGNPVWSFVYRQVIAELRHDFRCVALDYPGFGLSTAAPGYSFLPAEHATVVARFIDELALSDITLVVNDWGGPIGLSVAGGQPDRFSRLVIGNTWAWPVTGDPHFEWFARLMGGPLGRLLIARFNLFVNVLVPKGHARRRLPASELNHYRAPFPTPASRRPTSVFPRQITHARDWLAGVERGLDRLTGHPVLLLWGDRDIAFRATERERFVSHFPAATTVPLPGAGHFVASDAPAEVVDAIRAWHPHTAAQAHRRYGGA
ncbi:MAG TPA: alpha/beta fold hydrolase [Pilimelia sp.]|nr:alpha/beta fold hydrolase [Pilimelia sp.]